MLSTLQALLYLFAIGGAGLAASLHARLVFRKLEEKPKSTNPWRPIEDAPRDQEVEIGRWYLWEGRKEWRWCRATLYHLSESDWETGYQFSGWVWSSDYDVEDVSDDPTHFRLIDLGELPDLPVYAEKGGMTNVT